MIRSLRLIRLSTPTTASIRLTYSRCLIMTPRFIPFTQRHFTVETTSEPEKETKQRKTSPKRTSSKNAKQPELVVKNIKQPEPVVQKIKQPEPVTQKTELQEKIQTFKTPFHQALLAYALNNKKHLILNEESSQPSQPQQPQQPQEGIGKVLKKLRKWKQNRLYKCINDSLVSMNQNKTQGPMVPSTKRLCKSYFSLLQDHCDQMTRQEAASVIYFISKLQLEEAEMGQVVLLRAVSRRLCELFREKAELTIPAQQQRQTIRMMEEILHAPLKPLHEQFLSLLIQDKTSDASLSWHEQAQINKKKKQDKTQTDKKIYELLSPEFQVQLLINWQKTQNIDKSWRWHPTTEEKSIKELTQALVDKFVANENLVDYLTSKSIPKAQRVKIVPILAKYRGTSNLRQTYTQVLKRLQQGLEDQFTQYQDIKENLRSLVTILYFIHRSDMEPLERKKSIVRGDLEVEDIPYQCTVLPSLDKLFRGLILKPKKGVPKGNPEIPDFLRYDLPHNAFMMLSWLAANTLRFDQLSETSRQSILCNKLGQAHSHMLKENPLSDIFEPSVTRYLLTPLRRGQNKDSQAYLNQISQSKLFDRKSCLPETIDKIELGNLIIDVTPQLDVSKLSAQEDRQFVESLLNALYYGQMVPYTSLFFFRSQHLENVLDTLSRHPKFQRERDFWLKSEDMILRQREQYDSHKLCRLATIYSRVNPSQLFWNEIEQILLGKASDFQPNKETAQSLYSVIEALNKHNRRNETFWKVFSTTLSKTKHEFLESQLITLCSIFDAQNGQMLFQELQGRFLSNPAYLLPDSIQLVSRLAIVLGKHNATLSLEIGDSKQPLFVMALKYLIVKCADMQEAVTQTSNFEDLVSDMNLLANVFQVLQETLPKEVGLLKTQFRALAQKIIEKIDLTPHNEALQKVKASVLKLKFDHLSEQSQKPVSGQILDRQKTSAAKIQESKPDGASPFQHHPRFRQDDKKRSKSRKP